MDAQANVKQVIVEAVVTRADGTVEDHGVVAEWNADDETQNKGQVTFSRLKDILGR